MYGKGYVIYWIESDGEKSPCSDVIEDGILYDEGIFKTREAAQMAAKRVISEIPESAAPWYKKIFEHFDDENGRYIVRYRHDYRGVHIVEKELQIIEMEVKN